MKIQLGVYAGLVVLMLMTMGVGCASTRQTTTTETSVQGEQRTVTSGIDADEPNVVVEKRTTTTETTPEHRGLVGGIFHVIGSVIALPFILIGGLFRMIF